MLTNIILKRFSLTLEGVEKDLYWENNSCKFLMAANWGFEFGIRMAANSVFSFEIASITLSSGVTSDTVM